MPWSIVEAIRLARVEKKATTTKKSLKNSSAKPLWIGRGGGAMGVGGKSNNFSPNQGTIFKPSSE